MSDIYESLRDSHRLQRTLCRRLLATPAHAGKRTQVFVELRTELLAHAAAEERFLYAPIMMLDAGLSSSRHALSEHHQIDELLEELTVSDKSRRGWLIRARALSRKVHHHLKEEETKFFQVSGKLLSATRKRTLGREYRLDYARMCRSYAKSP